MRHGMRTGLAVLALIGAGASRAEAQITVGVVNSLSGPAASIGVPYDKGFNAAMVHDGVLAGQKMKLIRIDDSSDPAAAARAARKLVEEEHVDVLMGSAAGPASLAINAVAAELKVPFVLIANVFVPGDRGAWEITIPQPAQLMVAADVVQMKKAGIKTVAYIGYSEAWGDLVYDALKAEAEPAGIKIVTNERYARTDTSVTPQILKIIAAHPDAVLTGGSGSPGALPHLALAERGYRGPVYSTHAIINSEFVRVGGASVEGVIAPTGPVVVAEQLADSNPIKKVALQFRADYLAANHAPATDAFGAYSYDALLILAAAEARADAGGAAHGTPAYRDALRDALVSTKDVVGTHAVYNFTPGGRYGTDERSRVLVQLDHGNWKLMP